MKGQLDFVNNLRTEDAIYQRHCNSHFHYGKKPEVDIGILFWKYERPRFNERREQFEEIVEHLCQNDGKQTITCKL